MPKITFELTSHRGRPITDPVNVFILDGKRHGMIVNKREFRPEGNTLTADAPPDRYSLQLEINGFKLYRKNLLVNPGPPDSVTLDLTHRCRILPAFDDMHPSQQNLIHSLQNNSEPEQIWNSLTDNQCATFFQLSHALLKTELANGRTLISYIDSIRKLGGVEIEDDIPDGKIKRSVGWRMHVVIRHQDRKHITSHITEEGIFGDRSRWVNPAHAKFGLNIGHREKSALPRLQIVFDENYTLADIDLDVGFHRSSPHDVYKHFIKKFPDVRPIYRF